MLACHAHNLRRPDSGHPRPYGVRVSLRAGDPFARLLGNDWSRTYWFETVAERDKALAEMSREHEYSRRGDAPALVYTKVEKLAESRAR
jgi:hypothetical protein